MLICYEGVFPSITNDTVRRGAEVLVNITNDAWFGKSSAPYQHFASYIFRAVETDRYVLRAANTGISAVIDPRGRDMRKDGHIQGGRAERRLRPQERRDSVREVGGLVRAALRPLPRSSSGGAPVAAGLSR